MKLCPDDGARGEVRRSPELLQFIQRGTLVIELFHSKSMNVKLLEVLEEATGVCAKLHANPC